MAGRRARKGGETIGGRFYKGGAFIPAGAESSGPGVQYKGYRGEIYKALGAAFGDFLAELSGAFTEGISSPVWDWPNPPSPRDIVDSNRLRDSQDLKVSSDGLTGTYRFAVDYAIYVRYGYTTKNGDEYPGRDWIEYGLNKVQFDEVFPNRFEYHAKRFLQ